VVYKFERWDKAMCYYSLHSIALSVYFPFVPMFKCFLFIRLPGIFNFMRNFIQITFCSLLLVLVFLTTAHAGAFDFITNEHQLSVKEKRAGEAYYRAD